MIVHMFSSVQMAVTIMWVHIYDPLYSDGCDNTMDPYT